MSLNIGDPVHVEGWTYYEGIYVLGGQVKAKDGDEVEVEVNRRWSVEGGTVVRSEDSGTRKLLEAHLEQPIVDRIEKLRRDTDALLEHLPQI